MRHEEAEARLVAQAAVIRQLRESETLRDNDRLRLQNRVLVESVARVVGTRGADAMNEQAAAYALQQYPVRD